MSNHCGVCGRIASAEPLSAGDMYCFVQLSYDEFLTGRGLAKLMEELDA